MRSGVEKSNYSPISQVGNSNVSRPLHVQGDSPCQDLRRLDEYLHGVICLSKRQSGPATYLEEKSFLALKEIYVLARLCTVLLVGLDDWNWNSWEGLESKSRRRYDCVDYRVGSTQGVANRLPAYVAKRKTSYH